MSNYFVFTLDSLFLFLNQLFIHLFSFVIIETILFYTIIKKNIQNGIKKKIKRIFKKYKKKNFFDKNNKFNIEKLNTIEKFFEIKNNFANKYITSKNALTLTYLIVICLSIILLYCILKIFSKSDYIKKNLDDSNNLMRYNKWTTIISLLISLPIQIIYTYKFLISDTDPRYQKIIYDTIRE